MDGRNYQDIRSAERKTLINEMLSAIDKEYDLSQTEVVINPNSLSNFLERFLPTNDKDKKYTDEQIELLKSVITFPNNPCCKCNSSWNCDEICCTKKEYNLQLDKFDKLNLVEEFELLYDFRKYLEAFKSKVSIQLMQICIPYIVNEVLQETSLHKSKTCNKDEDWSF